MSTLLICDRLEAQVTPHELAIAEVQPSLTHSELQQHAWPALAAQISSSLQQGAAAWQACSQNQRPT